MSRTSAMTIGLVLIFVGIQLYVVQSYYLAPRTNRFLVENFGVQPGTQVDLSTVNPFSSASQNTSPGQSWPYYQSANSAPPVQQAVYNKVASLASFGTRRVTPPRWICWPILCLGVVFYLHGLAMRS